MVHTRASRTVLVLLLLAAAPASGGGAEHALAGLAAEHAGERRTALADYAAALDAGDLTAAQRAEVHYRRGAIDGALGEYASAIDEFSRAIELGPSPGKAYSLRGYLRGIVGDFEHAAEDHAQALALAADHGEATYLPWVLQNRADLWRRQQQYPRALRDCERALAARPLADAYLRRAWVHLDQHHDAEARADFRQFANLLQRQGVSDDAFWPEEREVIARLRALH